MGISSKSLNSFGNRGRELESIVEMSQGGVVCLSKMDAGARWFGGKLTPVPGAVDYIGEVIATKRAIFFDAKQSAEKASFPLDKVKDHQREFVRRHGQAGAIAGLLVGATHDEVGAYLWLDWKDLTNFSTRIPWESPAWTECGRWGGLIEFGRIPGVGL